MKRTARYWSPELAAAGSIPVARAFLLAYPRLQLTTAEALLVITLIGFKRGKDFASPSLGQLAERLGVEPRTVRGWARKLEKRGLLKRILRRSGHGREQTNLWDLSPLFERVRSFLEARGEGDRDGTQRKNPCPGRL